MKRCVARRKLNEREKKLRQDKLAYKKAIEEADRLWHKSVIKKWGIKCFFTETGKISKGHYEDCESAHHIKPKGSYPHLRYDFEDNGVPVCWPDHFKMEQCDRSMRDDIVVKRGEIWYNRLEKKAREMPASFKNLSWVNKQIEIMKKYLEE